MQRRLYHSQEMEDRTCPTQRCLVGYGTVIGGETVNGESTPQVSWYSYNVVSIYVDDIAVRNLLKPVKRKDGKIEMQRGLSQIIRKGAHFAGTVLYAAETWHEVVCATLTESPREANDELIAQMQKCERALKVCAETGELEPSASLLIETGLYQYLLRAEYIQATGGKRHYAAMVIMMLIPNDEEVAKMWEKAPKMNRAIGMEFRWSESFQKINEKLKCWRTFNGSPRYECMKIKPTDATGSSMEKVINVGQREAARPQEYGLEAWERIWPETPSEESDGSEEIMSPPKDNGLKRKSLPKNGQPVKWRALNDQGSETESSDTGSASQEESSGSLPHLGKWRGLEIEASKVEMRKIAKALAATLISRKERASPDNEERKELRYPWEGVIEKDKYKHVELFVENLSNMSSGLVFDAKACAKVVTALKAELEVNLDQPEYPVWLMCLLVHAYLAQKSRTSDGKFGRGVEDLDDGDELKAALTNGVTETSLLKDEIGLYKLVYRHLIKEASRTRETAV